MHAHISIKKVLFTVCINCITSVRVSICRFQSSLLKSLNIFTSFLDMGKLRQKGVVACLKPH